MPKNDNQNKKKNASIKKKKETAKAVAGIALSGGTNIFSWAKLGKENKGLVLILAYALVLFGVGVLVAFIVFLAYGACYLPSVQAISSVYSLFGGDGPLSICSDL